MLISPGTIACIGNSNPIHSEIIKGYSVGYSLDKDTVLSSDMHMWSFDDLVPGWYVAFNVEENKYYYITQDAAQSYFEEIKR